MLESPLPLRVHLVAYGLVVAVLGVLGGVAIGWRAWSTARAQWVEDSLRMAPMAAAAVDHFLQPAVVHAVHLAEVVGGLLEEGRAPESAPVLEALRMEEGLFASSALVDLQGRVLVASSPQGIPEEAPGDRPYFRRVLATGQPAVSEPLEAGGTWVILVAVPVRVWGEVRGVLTAALPLDRLRAMARDAVLGDSGVRLVLISPEGRFVTAPDPGLEGLPVDAYSDLGWADLGRARGPVPVTWTLQGPGGKEGYIGAFARARGSGWGAMVVRPRRLINRDGLVQGLAGFVVVLASALAVGVPGLLVLWRHLRGLSAVVESVEKAEGQGEPPEGNPIRPSILGSRELLLLSDRLTHMHTRLYRQHRDLQNAYRALRTAAFQTLLTLADVLDMREASTGLHSRRVGEFARLLAQRMGLPEEEVDRIARGAMLHDIGKIAIPDAILCKPGPLTDEEWEVMRQHPRIGAGLLSAHPELTGLAQLVLTHHERWDGRGYPLGLRGPEIPLGSRIFAVVDAFDAMIFDRPYRKAMTLEEAREEIRRCAGTQFDPTVVEAFLSIPDEEWQRVIHRYGPATLQVASLVGGPYPA